VSDFLARIAARAVGEAPRAQPRLPGPFERPATATGAEVGIEVVDERVAAPAPLALRPAGTPRSVPAPTEPELATPSALGGLGGANLAHQAAIPRAHEKARLEAPELASPTEPTAPVPKIVVTVEREVRTSPLAPIAAVVPALVPATPVTQSVAPPRAPTAAAAHERDDAAVVRVHIGRLDVRANLQEAPARPPRRARTSPEGLSLSDYLRGRREAG
jgi:hypothetical protein